MRRYLSKKARLARKHYRPSGYGNARTDAYWARVSGELETPIAGDSLILLEARLAKIKK